LTNDAESTVGPPLIGALMRMPMEAIRARMLTRLHEAGFADLVPAHLNVLRYPGPEFRRPSDLATEARMSKQAVNYLLGNLEGLGYLTREDDPDDRRSRRIELTARGRAVRQTIREAVREIEAEWEAELGPAEFARLRRLLVELRDTGIVRELYGPPGG
jgi:DNA-binding MarR family transcriptional regulator